MRFWSFSWGEEREDGGREEGRMEEREERRKGGREEVGRVVMRNVEGFRSWTLLF
jgi:hypothetical protein